MILQIEDWKFDIDLQRTMEYSSQEAADHCDCAYCRNFYTAVDKVCRYLRPFLAQFGLDVEAPDVLYPYDIDGKMFYEGEYLVFGSIIERGKHAITVGSAYVEPMEKSTHEHDAAHFVLSLENLEIPWELDEPLEDVISTANEPSFIQKMWDRLLTRGEKTEKQ